MKQSKQPFFYAVVPLCFMLLAACSHSASHASGHHRGFGRTATPAPIPTATVRLTTLHRTLSIAGIVSPFQNVAITSTLSEPAIAVNVQQGDTVRQGQIIAVLDTSDIRGQLESAQGSLQNALQAASSADAKVAEARYSGHLAITTGNDQVGSAQAAIAQARATLQNDTTNLLRDKVLVSQGYIPQQTYDQQQTLVVNDQANLRSAQASLQTSITNASTNGTMQQGLQASTISSAISDARAAHATVQTMEGQIHQYEVQIARASIISPINGVVVNRNINTGEYPAGRTIFTLQELDRVYVDLNASSADVFSLAKNSAMRLSISGSPKTYTGTVNAVLGQVSPGSTNFTVQAIVANSDGGLKSGLPVTGTIVLPERTGPSVPTTAFLDETHTSLMRIVHSDKNSVVKITHVLELASDGTTSLISGLSPGDQIVANGQLGLSDGQSVAAQ